MLVALMTDVESCVRAVVLTWMTFFAVRVLQASTAGVRYGFDNKYEHTGVGYSQSDSAKRKKGINTLRFLRKGEWG